MQYKLTKNIGFNAVQVLSLGFFTVILIGGIILSLPIASANGEYTNFIDALFTSTTSVCVTGLVTVDTGTHWNYFGKTVIMLLIEIGGLGFMSFATLIAIIIGKKITLKERLLMQEAMNTFSFQGMVKMVKYVLVFTFSVQLLGALLLATQFIPELGVGKGIYYSIFHSVSAFCNAGIDIIGNFNSVTAYHNNPVILLTISFLIIIGGLGFTVWTEIYNLKSFRKITTHSKVVILVTAILLIGGTVLMLAFEWNNPNTMKGFSMPEKLLNSWFASVSPRTAGFNSISTDGMSGAGKFLTIVLMFIGGSPGSTAGGIKTTTLGILVLTLIGVVKGREDTEVFGKRFSKDLVYKAFTVFFVGLTIVIIMTMLLSITEVGASFEYILYEVTSAFGTVGLTLGLTPNLTWIGKLLIIFTMYLGRVGPLTVALALTKIKTSKGIRYPEDKVLIG
ncbi:TrkH family potassium uptake protein [Clostridium sp. YIM B02551]|uniref:TrkH family potassium uptake protein n=1 Tax=Clostridium sp. YIM B02551 TaxID=2910679 RepID=UPI001EEBB108|nr:TrkH family potassium uptake protein [Clostridium sp. YIM B02551]